MEVSDRDDPNGLIKVSEGLIKDFFQNGDYQAGAMDRVRFTESPYVITFLDLTQDKQYLIDNVDNYDLEKERLDENDDPIIVNPSYVWVDSPLEDSSKTMYENTAEYYSQSGEGMNLYGRPNIIYITSPRGLIDTDVIQQCQLRNTRIHIICLGLDETYTQTFYNYQIACNTTGGHLMMPKTTAEAEKTGTMAAWVKSADDAAMTPTALVIPGVHME